MQCPEDNSELIAHQIQGAQSLPIIYSTCPTCHGYWMDSFAANFIKLPSHEQNLRHTMTADKTRTCPICHTTLARANGDNIPDTVHVFRCPNNHGYFFPAGELIAFKNAQQAKIAYHKLWNLPLPNVASVLLAAFAVVILTGGFIATYMALNTQQVTTSQARDILTAHHVYPVKGTTTILVTAITGEDATLTLVIPSLHNYAQQMATDDHRLHMRTVTGITAGTYHYRFIITINGKAIPTETFTFTMP